MQPEKNPPYLTVECRQDPRVSGTGQPADRRVRSNPPPGMPHLPTMKEYGRRGLSLHETRDKILQGKLWGIAGAGAAGAGIAASQHANPFEPDTEDFNEQHT